MARSSPSVLASRSVGCPSWRRSFHHANLRQDFSEGSDSPKRRPWFDRQGIIQAHAGFVVSLIALLSSYDHISLPAGINVPLQQQWGVWFIAASMALVLADAQLAHNPDIEKQINASKLRTKQLENEIELLRSESLRVRSETEQIEKENAQLSELNSKLDAIVFSSATNSTPTKPTPSESEM